MSNLPVEDLKELIRDTIYDTLYTQYSLFPKPLSPSRPKKCNVYLDQMTEVKMVNPCALLQDVMKEPINFPIGTMTQFNFLKFDESKIKYCPYCGIEFK